MGKEKDEMVYKYNIEIYLIKIIELEVPWQKLVWMCERLVVEYAFKSRI